jgi:hypothetical protein
LDVKRVVAERLAIGWFLLLVVACSASGDPEEHARLISCGDTQIARVQVDNPGPRTATYEVVLAYYDEGGRQIATAAGSETIGEGASALVRPRLAGQYEFMWTDCEIIAVTRVGK